MKFKFNVPNKITLIRVSLIPLFALILLVDMPYKSILAAFVFGVLSISDFFDGYLARKKGQVTEFGKLIDPIADKLLISTALVFLVGKGVDFWMAAAIIAREAILTAVRIYLLPSRIVVPASNFGKAKTVVQSIAIVFVLLGLPFGWHVMLAAVFLTLASGIEYLIRIKKMTGNKVVNLPNLITLTRFLLIIPYAYYLLNSRMQVTLLIFAIITLSDKLDGISARLMDQRTELGSAFDSFTDWTLIMATMLLLVTKADLSIIWVIIFAIPSLISGAIKMAYAKKLKVVPVTLAARLSVGLTYITIISIFIDFEYAFYLLVITSVAVYSAMAVYIFKALDLAKKEALAKRSSKTPG